MVDAKVFCSKAAEADELTPKGNQNRQHMKKLNLSFSFTYN